MYGFANGFQHVEATAKEISGLNPEIYLKIGIWEGVEMREKLWFSRKKSFIGGGFIPIPSKATPPT